MVNKAAEKRKTKKKPVKTKLATKEVAVIQNKKTHKLVPAAIQAILDLTIGGMSNDGIIKYILEEFNVSISDKLIGYHRRKNAAKLLAAVEDDIAAARAMYPTSSLLVGRMGTIDALIKKEMKRRRPSVSGVALLLNAANQAVHQAETLRLRYKEFACKPQTAVNWNEFFFIAVRDAKEQAAIPGTYWGKGCTSEGTVTVLVLADQTASQAEHKAKYEGYYMKTVFSYFDTGMACAFLTLAANDLGYSTHFFGTMNGASVGPKPGKNEFGTSNYDVGRFVSGRKYMRGWGFPEKETQFEVEGNCQLIACIVIGKANPAVDVVTAVTQHRRPSNWAIWAPDSSTPPLQVK